MNRHFIVHVCALALLSTFSFISTVEQCETNAASFLTMDVQKAFKDNEIVSDVIDVAPTSWVQVNYSSGVSAKAGNELTPTNVKDMPTLTWEADDNAYYTIIMTDPDAPNRAEPKYREVRHWLVVNVPGTKVSEGKHIFEFIGSGPPQGSGLHRYIFLVYKQSAGLLETDEETTSKRSRKNRLSSSTRKFVEKYNLGNPIAGNFYIAQFDDYVPQLHAQFTEDPPMKL